MQIRRLLAHSCLAVWLFVAGTLFALYRVNVWFESTFRLGRGLRSADSFTLQLYHFINPVEHYIDVCRLIAVFLGLVTLALYGGMLLNKGNSKRLDA